MSLDGESHLYDEHGRFRFLGKKLGICALCSSKDYTYGVGALGPSFRFCKSCIMRVGAKNLRRDSNHALANAKRKVNVLKHATEDFEAMQKRFVEKFGAPMVLHLPGGRR